METKNKVATRIKEYTATAINPSCYVYKKVFAEETEELSEAKVQKGGAIECAIEDWYNYLDFYRQENIFLQKGLHKLKSLHFFSDIKFMYENEGMDSYLKNYIAMMIRKSISDIDDVSSFLDSVWGTKWNLEHATQYYFENPNCFVMEGTNAHETNLFKEGFLSDIWCINANNTAISIDKSPHYIREASLIHYKAPRLPKHASLLGERINITKAGIYSLHFFIKCLVACKKDEGVSECIKIKITHTKTNNSIELTYANRKSHCWEYIREYVELLAGEYSIEIQAVKKLDLDYLCLFPAVNFPSLTIIVGRGEATHNNKNLFFAPGGADKVKEGNELVSSDDAVIETDDYHKYKFWMSGGDDSSIEAKEERKRLGIKGSEACWGYWSADGAFISLAGYSNLLEVLMPVGVMHFGTELARKI